jgi:hypothetical protein
VTETARTEPGPTPESEASFVGQAPVTTAAFDGPSALAGCERTASSLTRIAELFDPGAGDRASELGRWLDDAHRELVLLTRSVPEGFRAAVWSWSHAFDDAVSSVHGAYRNLLAAHGRATEGSASSPEIAHRIFELGALLSNWDRRLNSRDVANSVTQKYAKSDVWKEMSDHLFSPQMAVTVYRALEEARVIPPRGAPLVFFGATANIATHEQAIFDERRRGGGESIFVVGDRAEVRPKTASASSGEASFQFLRWDASKPPVRRGTVDVIWDRKGWLWYGAHVKPTTVVNVERTLASLAEYARLLKPGGCIVVDHIEGYADYQPQLTQLKGEISRLRAAGETVDFEAAAKAMPAGAHQLEPSTVDEIRTAGETVGVDLWSIISRRFEILDLGEGVLRVRVLRKRADD